MNTIMIIVTIAGLVMFGIGWVAFHGAFHERERARMSHLSGLDAKRLADQYHSAGKVMFKNALQSYEDGQEFWQAATVALLDAKRREAKVDQMLEAVGKPMLMLDPADGGVHRKEAV